ncbi:recombinase RecB [Pueribacillus theae]|uniref:Recombinase RecB n=1 Tax=Pueribacillus theae TaxID=2171751 RepID=A0A2U1JUK2_9BACI|nr:VRR-NUC domain-containing protein [Pueribacillus theae]PWA08629.1 recombinase RecB [Pueribacillus theae]
MSKPLEKHIETKIRGYLDGLGAYHIKTHGSAYSRAGTPDIICCINGKFVAIEVKRPTGVISELQKAHIRLIEQAGGVAFVAYSVADTKEQLQRFDVI